MNAHQPVSTVIPTPPFRRWNMDAVPKASSPPARRHRLRDVTGPRPPALSRNRLAHRPGDRGMEAFGLLRPFRRTRRRVRVPRKDCGERRAPAREACARPPRDQLHCEYALGPLAGRNRLRRQCHLAFDGGPWRLSSVSRPQSKGPFHAARAGRLVRGRRSLGDRRAHVSAPLHQLRAAMRRAHDQG